MSEPPGRQITVVLADDHTLVRQALRLLLASEPSFVVLGDAADGRLALDLAIELAPDVLVVDLMMPALGGMEVARQLARRGGSTRVLVLSMSISEAHVLEALAAGAHGYVRKDATASDLITAIREVAAGHRYLSPPYSDRAIEAYVQRAAKAADDPYRGLTTREREVLHLAAEGHGNRVVAARLGISPRTAETHRANVRRKLGLADQTALVRYALERGILPVDREDAARIPLAPLAPGLRASRPGTKGSPG
jgi:DNA-binding NarL/FixJ family response regulator